jgi:hypothetical protein
MKSKLKIAGKLGFRVLGPSMLMMTVLLLVGCGQTGQSGGFASGGGFGSAKERWTVVVKRLSMEQKQFADVTYNTLVRVQGLDRSKVRKVTVGEKIVVIYGEYSGIDDSRAQRDMKFIKSLAVPDQGCPFLDAHLEPMPQPDPPMPSSWDLTKSSGYWTLKIAQFDGAGRKQAALETVQQLREQQVPAYVYHGPVKSWVTIGSYPETAVGRSDMKALDSELKRWKQTYPYLLVNSEYAKFKSSHGAKKEIRLPSQIIKIPHGGQLW